MLADKTTDRFCEEFLTFVPLQSTSSKELARQILTNLDKLDINVNYMQTQRYDAAGAMSEKLIGTQKHVSEKNPNALYAHCLSHSLNLSICDSCELQDIRNCLGVIEKICVFFNTFKRRLVLEEKT